MKKILIVDDNEVVVQCYVDFLECNKLGEVRVAYNGKDALEKMLEDKPDVVLTDLEMPGMNGYELSKKIRENPEISDVYIIASSGIGLPDGMEKYIDENIPKNNAKYLLRRLRELLGGKENE